MVSEGIGEAPKLAKPVYREVREGIWTRKRRTKAAARFFHLPRVNDDKDIDRAIQTR
jgi:hypothetical protein